MAKVIPVIMSGGAGTRLWPLSTPGMPKQFHAFGGGRTLIQETALRFTGGDFLPPVVVCNAAHAELARVQLAEVGITPSRIVLEPVGRNTGPVALVAALTAREVDPAARVLLAPSDHVMDRPEALAEAIRRAAPAAGERIVTFGIRPSGPSTGYGYIRRGAALSDGVFAVDRFVEKPPLAEAERYVADGGYDWNAGLFLYGPEVMLAEAGRHAPDMLAAAEAAVSGARRDGPLVALDEAAFARAPAVAVDVAIMEKTALAAVAPCDPGWSDVGSWSELWKRLDKDARGNAVVGGMVIDGSNSLVWSAGGPPIAVLGVDDVVAVSTPEGVLILPRHRDQDVRRVVEALKDRN